MGVLYNLARMTTATTGTGTITLGAAVSGFLSFTGAGAANGDVVSYGISDGANSEVGTGTYTISGTTLTRTVTKSTNANAAINLSGTAQVFITARAEDLGSAAWSTWTPTVTPASGAFTTVSASGGYFALGKLVHFSVTITITTAGTASGTMSIPLPVGTANRAAAVFAQDFGATGMVGFGRVSAGGTTLSSILKYDNTTYIASGNAVVLTGFYEQQ